MRRKEFEELGIEMDAVTMIEQARASQQRSLKSQQDRSLFTSRVNPAGSNKSYNNHEKGLGEHISRSKNLNRSTKKDFTRDREFSEVEGSEVETSDEEFKPALSESDDEYLCEIRICDKTTRDSLAKKQQQRHKNTAAPLIGPLKALDLTFGDRSGSDLGNPLGGAKLKDVVTLSSSDEDSSAILRFSPPRTRSPCKKPPSNTSRPTTPTKSPSKSTLSSPQKLMKIPPTPHHQRNEEFWDAGVINSWNDKHSPVKPIQSPRKNQVVDSSDEESIRPQSPSPQKSCNRSPRKKDPSEAAAKKAFERTKHQIAQDFFQELDELITHGEISRLSSSTGGIQFVWSKKLNSTAGRANWRREVYRKTAPDNISACMPAEEAVGINTESTQYRHHASIELAEKVIDHETRLLNVIAHEYCHLANFMISGIKDQPHGASFKRWAKLVTDAFVDRGVKVTTKHSYEINYKYAWLCTNKTCGIEYSRHSRSIDPRRHTCGKCKSRLVQIRPAPRKANGGAQKQCNETGGQSQYQTFVKENYNLVKKELGEKSPMKDVMKEIGVRYRAQKGHVHVKPQMEEQVKRASIEVVDLTLDDDASNDHETNGHDTSETLGVGGKALDTVSRLLDFLSIRDTT